MIGMVYSLFKSLREERVPSPGQYPGAVPELDRATSRPSGAPTPQQMSAEDRREPGNKQYPG
jgi:hypothetical protein